MSQEKSPKVDIVIKGPPSRSALEILVAPTKLRLFAAEGEQDDSREIGAPAEQSGRVKR